MRILALTILLLPTTALAAPQCALAQPEPMPAAAAPSAPDLAAIPALRHIQEAGAQLMDLGVTHGLRAVFARNGEHFQVFYVAPDGRAVVGGILWDAGGDNVTRRQVEAIPGTIPTVTIGSMSEPTQPQPATSLIKAVEGTTYGLAGNASSPKLWMFFDPQCSFSVRAFQQLQPLVASGRVQLAIIPVSILDHEDGGLSTKTALSLLSLPPDQIAGAWAAGRVTSEPSPDAAAKLQANMAASNQIQLRGTPTFVWRNRDGTEGRLDGVTDDFGALITKLGG